MLPAFLLCRGLCKRTLSYWDFHTGLMFIWPLMYSNYSCNRSLLWVNTKTAHRQNGPDQNGPKILISEKIAQNGPLHCPKRPIIQPKRPIAKSKTAHSYIQNGPLSLSAFGNVQSDLEILYVESSYTRSDLVKPATVAIDFNQSINQSEKYLTCPE